MLTVANGKAGTLAKTGLIIASPNQEFRQRIHEEIGKKLGNVAEVTGGADALAKLDEMPCRHLFLDRQLTDLNADKLEQMLRDLYPGVEILLFDSLGEPENASTPLPEQMTFPDLDMADEPASPPEVLHAPRIEMDEATRQRVEPLPGMIGSARTMGKVFRLARLVASRNTTVLITGETGTGKELVARAIHNLSPRASAHFSTINCAAIPETLLEAELFGHARGAFTGAVQSSLGRIHAAHGGTLFLDEVGDLPLRMQAKLLRFLQCGEVQRLGSSDVFRVDVRVVAATNADLTERVKNREFRADLYYRLMVFPIELPPLKDRVEDVVPLAKAYLDQLCRDSSVLPKKLTPAAEELLKRHTWRGNVRELQHAVERAFILAQDDPEMGAGLFQMGAHGALTWSGLATNSLSRR